MFLPPRRLLSMCPPSPSEVVVVDGQISGTVLTCYSFASDTHENGIYFKGVSQHGCKFPMDLKITFGSLGIFVPMLRSDHDSGNP